ncbi:putative bacteriophage tail protein/phage tail tape measure protein, TP901 family [Avibacterium paragallinarum]|uniref:Putative bacteriophage tail protein/phage tail tape measure protein, TP901 family n=1 Tax=Avibacterium paragallinarum TaxID=728 RepID=A0A377I6W2_AVIPA|nr:hypothetical protein [Avibacterium paragallinarum]STO71014.1 putative bacteriophage tail protein/phage tail tape measure protein, TP901 family [Avibacterium paragallinarum]
MATNELMIGLVIGTTLKGVSAAFQTVTKLSSRLSSQIEKATAQTKPIWSCFAKNALSCQKP